MAVGGDMIVGVGGALSTTIVADKYESVGGDEATGITGSEYRSIGNESVTYVGGVKQEILNGDWSVTSGGNIELLSDGSVRIKCKDFIIDAESITLTTSAGDVKITASGIINAKGRQIRLND
jgi:hypothetical protein